MKTRKQHTPLISIVFTFVVALIVICLPHSVSAESARFTLFKVEINTTLEGSTPNEPVKDFYINAGSDDGLSESSILDVYREKIITDPATDQDSAISIPVGQVKVVKLFKDVTIARILSLTVVEDTPVLKYRMVMIGDYAVPAKRQKAIQAKDIPSESIISTMDIPQESPSADPSILLPAKVLFRFNDWRLKPEALVILARVHDTFQKLQGRDILIEGHTCNLGPPAYNLDLSRKRAQSVADHLTTSMGIPANLVHVQHYGEKSPIASNATAEGRVMNRRVVIRFPPTKPKNS